ncbi:50S ribosomal protein L29 [Candidatus Peregrinibacteria bacterium]|nr:50S ribosomal protein L29 [Candidatus Peregrinibacteria bacterium]
MLKLEELKKMSKEEVSAELADATKKLFKLNFEVKTGSSKASNDLRKLKKYRAQILTIQKETLIEEKKKFMSQKTV